MEVNGALDGEVVRDNEVVEERDIEREDGPILYSRLRQEKTVDCRHTYSARRPQFESG